MFFLGTLGLLFATFGALDAQQCYRCFGRHWCNDVSHPDFASNVTVVNCPATGTRVSYEGNSPIATKIIRSLEGLSSSSRGEDAMRETTWGCVTATIHEAHEVHTIRTCLNNAETICPVVQSVILNPDLNDVPEGVQLDCGGCIGMLCNDHTFAPHGPGTSSTASTESTSSSTDTPDSTSSTTPTPETSTSTTNTGSPDTPPSTPSSSSTLSTTQSPETSASTTTPSSPTIPSTSSTTTTSPSPETTTSESTTSSTTPTSTPTTATPESSTTTPESSTIEVTTTTPEIVPETTTPASGHASKVSYGMLMLALCIEWIRFIGA